MIGQPARVPMSEEDALRSGRSQLATGSVCTSTVVARPRNKSPEVPERVWVRAGSSRAVVTESENDGNVRSYRGTKPTEQQ